MSPDVNRIFCAFRRISGLPGDRSAAGFQNLLANGRHDADSQTRLRNLKAALRHRFCESVHDYTAFWTGNPDAPITVKHIGRLPDRLEDCLVLNQNGSSQRNLCVDVWRHLSTTILAELQRAETVDPLEAEVDQQRSFGRERSMFFVGRTATLEAVRDYVLGPSRYPLIITGSSGAGKTALMAECARRVETWLPSALPVVRYAGATPASSDVRILVRSICLQLGQMLRLGRGIVPKGYLDLRADLHARLARASPGNPVVLIVDAPDRLTEPNDASCLGWLPQALPPGVRVVVSIQDDWSASYRTLLGLFPKEAFIGVTRLSLTEASTLLERWTGAAGRTLQPWQRQVVLDRFKGCPTPLYLRLVFEQAKQWKSYADSSTTSVNADVPGVIRDLLGRLSSEANHGEVLVSRALGYLAASRRGLTEDELLSVLSEDTEVLSDFKRRSPKSPDIDRLPVVAWSRLFADLDGYLYERSADRTTLLSFFHRQVADGVVERYLTPERQAAVGESLIRFFDVQPHWNRRGTPNYRKVSELPWLYARHRNWALLYELLSELPFFLAASSVDSQQVLRYWARVEDNTAFRKVEAYRVVLENPERYAEYIPFLGDLLFSTGQAAEALKLNQALLEQSDGSADSKFRVMSLTKLALSHKALQDYPKALELLEEADHLSKPVGDHGIRSVVLLNKANVLTLAGDRPAALALYRQHVQDCREHGDWGGLQAVLGNLAVLLTQTGERDEAVALLKEQEEICLAMGQEGKWGLAYCYGAQGSLSRDVVEALTLHRKEEALCRELGNKEQLAKSLSNQARLQARTAGLEARLGNDDPLEKVAEKVRQSEEILAQLGLMPTADRGRGSLARWEMELETPTRIEDLTEKIRRRGAESEALESKTGETIDSTETGKSDGASPSGELDRLGRLAASHARAGEMREALAIFQQQEQHCRSHDDRETLCRSLLAQAQLHVYELKQPQLALDKCNEVIELQRMEVDESDLLSRAQTLLQQITAELRR